MAHLLDVLEGILLVLASAYILLLIGQALGWWTLKQGWYS